MTKEYVEPVEFDFNDKKHHNLVKAVLAGAQNRDSAYCYTEYDEMLKIVNPKSRGNDVISFSLLAYDHLDGWLHLTDSSCNEVLSSHFFRNVYPDNISRKREFFYLSIFANPLFHGHILSSIHRYFKIVLGSKFVPVEQIPLKYNKNTIETHKEHHYNYYSDWCYDKKEMETMLKNINKVDYGFMYPLTMTANGRSVSKENRAELAFKACLTLKIPMCYGYSTLSMYTLGIAAKVGQFLNHEKPFEEAFLEFSTKTFKQPFINGSEPVRRWKNMEEVLKKVRNLKFTDVFPSYTKSKQQSAGYDTVKRKINGLNTMIRRSPENISEIREGRTVFMELDELTSITSHINFEYVPALVTKPVAIKLANYLAYAVKLMDDFKKDLEKVLHPVREPKAAKVIQ